MRYATFQQPRRSVVALLTFLTCLFAFTGTWANGEPGKHPSITFAPSLEVSPTGPINFNLTVGQAVDPKIFKVILNKSKRGPPMPTPHLCCKPRWLRASSTCWLWVYTSNFVGSTAGRRWSMRITYDFTQDDEWNRITNEIVRLKMEIKKREDFLKKQVDTPALISENIAVRR